MNSEECLRTWNTYQAAWGPISDAHRLELLAQSVSDAIVYTDPVSQVEGRQALVQRIAASQARFPGCRFQNGSFLEHHGQALFHWTMYDATGSAFVTGSSFARFDDDGRLVQATGFFKGP